MAPPPRLSSANSKGKASAMPSHSPPRGPLPRYDSKQDALGRCCEGELAEDKRRSQCKGAADHFLAMREIEIEKPKRLREVQDKIGASRDAVFANLRLLSQAHASLISSPRNLSVQFGKENLSLGDVLQMFDNLKECVQENSKPNAAMLLEMDKLHKERNDAIEQVKVAQQYRNLHVDQVQALQQQRDTLQQEKDKFRDELELLRRERDDLRIEKDVYHERCLQGEADRKSATTQVQKEKGLLQRTVDRYRQERNNITAKHDLLQKDNDLCQKHKKKMEEELAKVRLELSMSEDEIDALTKQAIRMRRERDEARVQRDSIRIERDSYHARSSRSEEELKDLRGQLLRSKNDVSDCLEQSARLLQERDEAREESDRLRKERNKAREESYRLRQERNKAHEESNSLRGEKDQYQNHAAKIDGELTDVKMQLLSAEKKTNTYASLQKKMLGEKQANSQKAGHLQAELKTLQSTLDSERQAYIELARERDILRTTAEQTGVQLQCLTARLQSCHCSAGRSHPKRTHDQTLSEDDDMLDENDSDRSNRSVRRTLGHGPGPLAGAAVTGMGPSLIGNSSDRSVRHSVQERLSGAFSGGEIGQNPVIQPSSAERSIRHSVQGRVPGTTSGGTIGQNLVIQPSLKWRIEDVLNKHFTAPPVPQSILTRLRGQIRGWDQGIKAWRKGGDAGVRKCINSACHKKKSNWKDGDSGQACEDCRVARRLCAVACEGIIELLPLRKEQGPLRIDNDAYWIGQE